MWKYGTLSVSPFDWLEASYFYYRPTDLKWGGQRGLYLDKGFNVKITYRPKNSLIPNLAIGLDDFSGTGLFTKEYMVMSKGFTNSIVSLGLGWGKFAGENSFGNPLSNVSERFNTRPLISDNYNTGGMPSYDMWFRGDASIFGGIEYLIPKSRGLKFKLELDPFDYKDLSSDSRLGPINEIRKKDSDINFGLSFPWNNYLTFDLSYIKGNTVNFSFSYGLTFNSDNLSKKPKFNPELTQTIKTGNKKRDFYEDLLNNLNRNRLLLQTSDLDEGNLDISISTSEYRNAIRSSSYASYIANKIARGHDIDLKTINISHINAGVEINEISYIAKYYDNDDTPIELVIRNTTFDSGEPNGYQQDEFQPNVKFPALFSSLSPSIRSYIGNPQKFYFGGVDLNLNSEVQFSRNLILYSELVYPMLNNFSDVPYNPDSLMQGVRTDIVKYLQEDDIHINRMQLDYMWSPFKEVYSKITAGIFEQMFGGFGGELLYRPFDKNYHIGFEIFYVKQRSFEKKFNFQDYRTSTGHINFGYRFAKGVESNISYGRYLAKDDGFTFDLSRTTKSGFKAGIYFTRTDVPAEIFGEGSFDKGFYFQIPLDLISNQYSSEYSNFRISPLTRDGGAKLRFDNDLKGLIYNSTNNDLFKQWNGYRN